MVLDLETYRRKIVRQELDRNGSARAIIAVARHLSFNDELLQASNGLFDTWPLNFRKPCSSMCVVGEKGGSRFETSKEWRTDHPTPPKSRGLAS